MSAQATRALVAGAILALVLLVSVVADLAMRGLCGEVPDGGPEGLTRLGEVASERSYGGFALDGGAQDVPMQLFERMGGLPLLPDRLPPAFDDEVLSPGDLDALQVVCVGSVAGVVCPAQEDIAERVLGLMQQKGWKVVEQESSLPGALSCALQCVKHEGAYRWTSVAIYSMGDSATCVFQLLKEEGA